jgi:predicted TIM-barrel fold metal-dependent hydrolase
MTIDAASLTAFDVHLHLEAEQPSATDEAARKVPLIQYANSLLKTKVLFGSDYPWIMPDRYWRTSRRSGSRRTCGRSS